MGHVHWQWMERFFVQTQAGDNGKQSYSFKMPRLENIQQAALPITCKITAWKIKQKKTLK